MKPEEFIEKSVSDLPTPPNDLVGAMPSKVQAIAVQALNMLHIEIARDLRGLLNASKGNRVLINAIEEMLAKHQPPENKEQE